MGNTLQSTVGRFKILKRLGEGARGSVYLARDPAIDRVVAIKLLDDVESEEMRERFARSAKAAGTLRHQNIVVVFEVGQNAGQPFIVMEYVEGFTLARVVREKRPVPLDQRVKWLQQLCDGLAYTHRQGIVLRDINPANIMVDEDDTLKIFNFGMARLGAAAAFGLTPTLMGLTYMSPELMAGRPVDRRSDIFMVGQVCYELLAYQRAFPGDIQDGVLHRIIHESPTPLEQFVPGIDPQLVAIVNRALEKDRELRYQDLSEMKSDLAAVRSRLQQDPPPSSMAPVDWQPKIPVRSSPPPGPFVVERANQRRAQQIGTLMDTATQAMSIGELIQVEDACENVLVLDPTHADALALYERAHSASQQRKAEGSRS